MFLGQFTHTLDNKGRTSIPKKFRDEIKNGAILTRGLDECIFLYTKGSWQSLTNKVKDLPLTATDARSFSRYLFSGAVEANFDPLGRISIPDYLRDYAKLEKEIVVVGVFDRVEIWSKEKWDSYSQEINTKSAETAEKISEKGI